MASVQHATFQRAWNELGTERRGEDEVGAVGRSDQECQR